MATSNLHLAQINREPIPQEQLKLGMVADFPSGMGGTIKCECVRLTQEKAVFEPCSKDFPKWAGYTIKFNQQDFTLEDFEDLSQALESFNSVLRVPTDEDRALVRRARSLGYAHSSSYTQASWSLEGANKYHQLKNLG